MHACVDMCECTAGVLRETFSLLAAYVRYLFVPGDAVNRLYAKQFAGVVSFVRAAELYLAQRENSEVFSSSNVFVYG